MKLNGHELQDIYRVYFDHVGDVENGEECRGEDI